MTEDTPNALRRITANGIVRAAGLVQRGQVYDLGAEMSDDMPETSKDTFMPYRLLTYRTSKDMAKGGDMGRRLASIPKC